MSHIEVIARAVVVVDGQVLLCRADGADHDFLPGGHVEFGESVATSLAREFREELGDAGGDTRIGAYLGSVEHAYSTKGGPHHEINHCFSVGVLGLSSLTAPQSIEPHISFRWSPLDGITDVNLLPAIMIDVITEATTESGPRWRGTMDSSHG